MDKIQFPEFRICTGFGQSDTHSITLSTGKANPHSSAGSPYETISIAELAEMVVDPPSVPKEQGRWCITSTYHNFDARTVEAQRQRGQFVFLNADIDKGSPTLEEVNAAVDKVFSPYCVRMIYSSRNATEEDLKWHIHIPLLRPVGNGRMYEAYQERLHDVLEKCGLKVDRNLEKPAQLIYWPNKGEHYEHHIGGSEFLDPLSPDLADYHKYIEEYVALNERAAAAVEQQRGTAKLMNDDGTVNLFVAANLQLDMSALLAQRYEPVGGRWRYKHSTTGSPAGRIYDASVGPWDNFWTDGSSDLALVGRRVDPSEVWLVNKIEKDNPTLTPEQVKAALFDKGSAEYRRAQGKMFHEMKVPVLDEDGEWHGEIGDETVHQHNARIRARKTLEDLMPEGEAFENINWRDHAISLLQEGNLLDAAKVALRLEDEDLLSELESLARDEKVLTDFRKAISDARIDIRKEATEARGLLPGKDGSPAQSYENVRRIVSGEADEKWEGVLAVDQFAKRIKVLKPMPLDLSVETRQYPFEFNLEKEALSVLSYLQTTDFPTMTLKLCQDACVAAAEGAGFHPVRDYLAGLAWDGTPRLHGLFYHYFSVEIDPSIPGHQEYVEQAGIRFGVACVARVMQPGCKSDAMPVLVSSKQGYFKSTGLKVLAGESWFGDNMPALDNKDVYDYIQGLWIVEIAEMQAIKGKDVGLVKKYLSSTNDRHRPAYARSTADYPRQTMFAGSGNEERYLADTENRRFWPLTVAGLVRVDELRAARDQLWAEALCLYQNGHKWWFDQEEFPALEAVQAEARQVDAGEEAVRDYLRRKPDDTRLLAYMVARDVFELKNPQKGDSMRISRYMHSCGWSQIPPIGIKSGGQRYYRRGPEAEPYAQGAPDGRIKVGEENLDIPSSWVPKH